MQGFMLVMQTEPDAFQPKPFNVIGPQVSFRIEPVEEDACLGQFGHFGYPRVIQVEDGDTILGQGLNQFGFAAENGFLGSGPFGVNGADIGDHADLWLGNLA